MSYFSVTDESRGSGIQTSMSMIWPRRESPSPPPGRRRQSAGDTLDGPRRNSPVRIGPGKKKGEPLRVNYLSLLCNRREEKLIIIINKFFFF